MRLYWFKIKPRVTMFIRNYFAIVTPEDTKSLGTIIDVNFKVIS